MAETLLHNYSVQERLNKMDVDLVSIVVSPDSSDGGSSVAGDLLFQTTEIPNAVAVPGGTALLHSCAMITDVMITGQVDFIIMSENISVTSGGNMATGVAVASGDNTYAEMDAYCGHFSVKNAFDAGVLAIGNQANIGIVCKAAANSRSLYVWGIQQSAADYDDPSEMVLRFGFIKD